MDLANTIFGGAPTDKLISVDPAQIKNSETHNFITDTSREFAQEAADLLRRSKDYMVDAVMDITGIRNSTNVVDAGLRIARIMAGNGASFGNLSNELKYRAIEMIPNDNVRGIVRMMGQDTNISENPYLASQIFDVLTDYAGDSSLVEVFDADAEVALLTTVGQEALRMGVPRTLDVIKDNATDQWVWERVLTNCAEEAARSGSIGGLEMIVDNVGSEVLGGYYPALSRTVLEGYKLPEDTPPDQYPEQQTALVEVLAKVDSGWDSFKGMTDLTAFSRASDDAKTLLLQTDEHRDAVMLAGLFSEPVDLMKQAREMYPYAVV